MSGGVKLDPREAALNQWEHRLIHPGQPPISIEAAQGISDHVWGLFGLGRGPRVRWMTHMERDTMPKGLVAFWNGTAVVGCREGELTTTVMLHELAHALTEDPLETMDLTKPHVEKEFHGDVFLSNYLALLDRLMGLRYNKARLMSTLPPGRNPAWHPVVWGKPVPCW